MKDPRKAPDRRSPVQPGRSDLGKFIFLAVLGIGAIWSLRDVWVDPDAVPYETGRDAAATEASTPPGRSEPSQRARGNLTALFNADDYPVEAMRREEQGTVGVDLRIDRQGRVSRCTVSTSSGSDALDRKTCEILQTRARFQPATDLDGRPVSDVYSQRITWRLE